MRSPNSLALHTTKWRPNSLLDRLSPQARRELEDLGRPTVFGKGEVLVAQGEHHPAVYVLTGGVVKATRIALPDSIPMLVTLFTAGDSPGTADALLDEPAHVTYTAIKPTRALAVPRMAFVEFVNTRHARTALIVLANELRLRDMSLAYATTDVRSRLIGFLEHQRVANGIPTPQGAKIDLGLSQADIAAAIGAAPGTVGRELADLQKQELIGVGHRVIYIKKEELRIPALHPEE